MNRIYRWLLMFSYRRLAKAMPKAPAGLPLMRDPDNVCPAYEPRERKLGDFQDCEGDGPYPCKECCHFARRGDAILEAGEIIK